MKKIVFFNPQVMTIMGTTYQVGDYDDCTSFAIVSTPGYETLTINEEDVEDIDCHVNNLAIERYIAQLDYPAWCLNAGNIKMKNKQAEEIDRLGTRDRYTYSITPIGVFDRLVTRSTLAHNPHDIYPFPIVKAWDKHQIDAVMTEFKKSIPWDENYHTLQEKLRAQIATVLEVKSEITLPDLTKIYRIEHGETELNEYIEIASRSPCHFIDITVQDSIELFEDEDDENPTINMAPRIVFHHDLTPARKGTSDFRGLLN
jgi:hypothetical protein